MLAGRSATALLAAAVLLLGGACSGDDTASDAEQPTTGDAAPEPSALCRSLTPEELTRVIGGRAPEPLADSTHTRCHWQTPGERAGLVGFVLPAEDWAEALPSSLPQLKVNRDLPAKDRRLVERLEREVGAGALSHARACEVFADVARVSVMEAEAGAMVNFVPAGAVNPHQGVTAQRCEDGRFASLTAYAADALPDRATARRTARALGTLLRRVG